MPIFKFLSLIISLLVITCSDRAADDIVREIDTGYLILLKNTPVYKSPVVDKKQIIGICPGGKQFLNEYYYFNKGLIGEDVNRIFYFIDCNGVSGYVPEYNGARLALIKVESEGDLPKNLGLINDIIDSNEETGGAYVNYDLKLFFRLYVDLENTKSPKVVLEGHKNYKDKNSRFIERLNFGRKTNTGFTLIYNDRYIEISKLNENEIFISGGLPFLGQKFGSSLLVRKYIQSSPLP